MKLLSKLILITFQLSLCAFGAESVTEKPSATQKEKPVLTITAFTLKSSDGRLEMKMDHQGRILVDGKHVATANSKGEFHTPEGKLLTRFTKDDELDPDLMGASFKVTRDGTLMGSGESHSWVEGKFQVGIKGHLEITPKDSPSKQAATVMFILSSVLRGVAEPK